ncbi:hypothetical protein BD560DRAFT_429587 [Blakeslea trispora]|nr:hypothetical protein BD560DRAFT_429587 [Blakeslea trispora]
MDLNSKRFEYMKEEFLNLCLETPEEMEIFNEALAAHGFHWEDGHLVEGFHRSSNTLSSEEKTVPPRWNKVSTTPTAVWDTTPPPRARAPPLVQLVPMQAKTKRRRVQGILMS